MTAHALAGWLTFVVTYGLPFTLYVVAQLFALLRLRGHSRVWAALPIPFMVWIAWMTVDGFRQQLNLWPLPLIILSPVALLYLGVVAMIARSRNAGKRAMVERP